MNQVSQVTIDIDSLRTIFDIKGTEAYDYCLDWHLTIDYNFETFAVVNALFESSSVFCPYSHTEDFSPSFLLIHAIVLFLAVISLILSWRSIYQMARDYSNYRHLYKRAKQIYGRKTVTINSFNFYFFIEENY